jgi:1A family penicillin-binding protein
MPFLVPALRAQAFARGMLGLLLVPLLGSPLQAQNDPSRIVRQPQASLVLARDGSMIGEIGAQSRLNVPLRSLPPHVPRAFIAIEDHRFYQHDGVDVIGIAGALKDAILGARRGASTITQQLIGNMHPEIIDRSDVSVGRKLREQQAAREMERRYTKQQILEAYLNQLDFGHGWFGIESAARHYFGKPAARLTLAEAATLAAIINGPSYYDPFRHADRARERRNLVLRLMADQGHISRARAAEAQRAALRLAPFRGMSAPAEHFVDVVRVQAERLRVPVREGGYRIYTSLDSKLQRAAAEAVEGEASAFEQQAGVTPGQLEGAVVAIDPATGDVRALVGGRDYRKSQFNRAVDGMRQPGSAFKPIVYAAALAATLTPTTLVGDTAIAIPLHAGALYRPANSDNQFLGVITAREALAQSRNVVAVQLALNVGLDSVIAVARRMGINSAIAPYPSSAIGASAVQPLDLVAAYTTFANLGTPVEPRFIQRIEDAAGRIVYNAEPLMLPPALDPRVAFVVRDIMRDVVARGTATVVRRYLPDTIPVAGKTGTTDDNTDAWFIGIVPGLVAGVWMGFDRPGPIPGASGGALAAPVFGRMIASAGAARRLEWTPPPGVIAGEADRSDGELATDTTSAANRYTEYWIEGTEPDVLKFDPLRLFPLSVSGL